MKNKTVLITGCSSGFGRGLVTAYLQDGWTVLATLRNSSKRSPELFGSELKKYEGKLFCLELDVENKNDRDSMVSFIQNQFSGKLDALVNNAGYGLFGVFEELSEDLIRKQMEVNFFGCVLLTQALLPSIRATRGVILNLSSMLGFFAPPMSSLYCASKFAIEGWSESLHFELAPHGVRVVLIEPGSFNTQFGSNLMQVEAAASRLSVYSTQTKKHQALRKRIVDRKSGNPNVVVQKILKISNSNCSPVRVMCGKDAKSTYWMKRVLPTRILNLLLSVTYQKLFS